MDAMPNASPWVHRVHHNHQPKGNSMIAVSETTTEQVTLYYRKGASDKVYQSATEPIS